MSKPDERLLEETGRVRLSDRAKAFVSEFADGKRGNKRLPDQADWREFFDAEMLVPRAQVAAAVAAALELASQHWWDAARVGCSCGWLLDTYEHRKEQWQEHIRSLATPAQRGALDSERQRVRLEEAESIAKAECGLCQEGIPVYQCEEPSCWMHVNSGSYKESHPICDAQFARERIAALCGTEGKP